MTTPRFHLLTTNPYLQEKIPSYLISHDEDDSGMDLLIPQDITIPPMARGFAINHQVKGEFIQVVPCKIGACSESLQVINLPYFLFPRSSISSTPLIMCNSVGIMDRGYRGDLIAKVHNLSNEAYVVKQGTRLFQVCLPNLSPFDVKMVAALSPSKRGEKGFGSTS